MRQHAKEIGGVWFHYPTASNPHVSLGQAWKRLVESGESDRSLSPSTPVTAADKR